MIRAFSCTRGRIGPKGHLRLDTQLSVVIYQTLSDFPILELASTCNIADNPIYLAGLSEITQNPIREAFFSKGPLLDARFELVDRTETVRLTRTIHLSTR
jgi:hypothetical protein